MKLAFNVTSIALGSLLTVFVYTSSSTAYAIENGAARTNEYSEQLLKNTDIRSKLCERYNSSRFSDNLKSKDSKVRDEFATRRDDLGSRRMKADEKRIELQSRADSKRQEHYAKLLENATTDAQVMAINEFKQEVESAVEERRLAMSVARENYRAGVDAAIEAQKNVYDLATTSLALATSDAIATAKESCEAGASTSDVSATLKAELKVARETFSESTEDMIPVRDALTDLRERRGVEYEQAKLLFDERMDSARRTLKAAFNTKSTDSND